MLHAMQANHRLLTRQLQDCALKLVDHAEAIIQAALLQLLLDSCAPHTVCVKHLIGRQLLALLCVRVQGENLQSHHKQPQD